MKNENLSRAMKEVWANKTPEERAAIQAKRRAGLQRPEVRQRMSEARKAAWARGVYTDRKPALG